MTDQEKIKLLREVLEKFVCCYWQDRFGPISIEAKEALAATVPTQPEPERDTAAPFIQVVAQLDNSWIVYKGFHPETETEPAAQVIGYMIGLLMKHTERARAALERK